MKTILSFMRSAVNAGSDIRMQYEGGDINHEQWKAGLEKLAKEHAEQFKEWALGRLE